MLESLQKIVIEKPVDKIIKQIKSLITNGEIKPGEKLPPERKLASHLGVSRSQVREAFQKLEFYGILRTLPQSGTYVSGIGIVALEGLISDVLNLDEHDFASLVETRVLLEKEACVKAAKNRTERDLAQLEKALEAYATKVLNNESAIEEDLLFHLKIAEAGKNNVLKSLLMIITPDIVKNYINLKVCDNMHLKALEEHREILNHIKDQNPEKAAKAMQEHLSDVQEFSKKIS